jgi:hypothetical protein
VSDNGCPLRKMHQDDVRAKIQTSQLLNRLADHALNGDVELSATKFAQSRDLQAIELSGDEDNPVEVITRIE